MYRNIVYNSRNKECIIFGWDKEGNRIKYSVPFKPYIYLITNNNNSVATSIFNEPLIKKEFETQYDRFKFLKDHEYPRVYNNLEVQQECLVDLFWQNNETPEFSKNPLNIGFFDIETYSPNGFPDIRNAIDEINAITLYSSLNKTFYTFGCKPYNSKDEDVKYIYCENEKVLLKTFVNYVNNLNIDLLAAWNGEGFDYPYICNRIINVCGEETLKKLSPVHNELFKPISMREVIGDRGENLQKWTIEGLSLIDYMLVYKKYTYVDRPSFSLNYIANVELSDQKIEHENESLVSLADNNWEKFIDYNIQDVRLLAKLDQKLKFINLLKLQSYAGCCTLEKAMGTISVTLGALAVRCKHHDKILMTKVKLGGEMIFEGGYVMEPVKGFHDDIISVDANSLYPNTCISLNISPETKLGKIIQEDEDFIQFKSNKDGKISKIHKDKFLDYCKKQQIAISKSGVLFTQDKVGILAEYMDYYYKKRVETKKQLKATYKELDKAKNEKEKSEIKERIEYLDLLQLALKIQINAAYGFFGTPYCPLGDTDITSSITKSGQAVVQQAGIIAWNYMKEHGVDYDPRVYMDTDSNYLTFNKLFKHLGIKLHNENYDISKEALDIIEDYEKYLNTQITLFAQKEFNSKDSRFYFKREVIADKGFFIAKKRYAVRVLDDEGKKVKKLKYKGIDIVRNSVPEKIKPLAKEWLECMVVERDRIKCNNILKRIYNQLKEMSVEDISFTINCSNMEKYTLNYNQISNKLGIQNDLDEFKMELHCPYHIRSSHAYNVILKRLGLQNKYDLIRSGDKVKIIRVTEDNKYKIKVLSYKDKYPEEFKSIFKIDYDAIFDKVIFSMVERFNSIVMWEATRPTEAVHTDLFDFLS